MLSRKRRNPKATHRDISLTAADTDGRTDQRARNARGMQMRLRLRRAAGGCIDRPHQAVGAAAQPIPAMGRVLYVVAVAGLPAGSVWSEPLGVNRKGEPLAAAEGVVCPAQATLDHAADARGVAGETRRSARSVSQGLAHGRGRGGRNRRQVQIPLYRKKLRQAQGAGFRASR